MRLRIAMIACRCCDECVQARGPTYGLAKILMRCRMWRRGWRLFFGRECPNGHSDYHYLYGWCNVPIK